MFDSRRKFACCMLCDRTDLNAEHIFGNGLRKRLWKMPNWRSLDEPKSIRLGKLAPVDGGAPIVGITSPILCIGCNNGFSDEMDRVLAPLTKLIFGTARDLSDEDVRDLKAYFERVAFIVDIHTS